MKYYLYRHIRLDTGVPFYIGIGTKQFRREWLCQSSEFVRAFCKTGRNSIWNRIVAKTNYATEILYEDTSSEFIRRKEEEFIKLYGRINNSTGCLSNLTDGGEGTKKTVISEETRNKLRVRNRVDFKQSVESKIKIGFASSLRVGDKSPKFGKKGLKSSNYRVLIDFNTGVFYESIEDAANVFGLKSGVIKKELVGKNTKIKTNLKYA